MLVITFSWFFGWTVQGFNFSSNITGKSFRCLHTLENIRKLLGFKKFLFGNIAGKGFRCLGVNVASQLMAYFGKHIRKLLGFKYSFCSGICEACVERVLLLEGCRKRFQLLGFKCCLVVGNKPWITLKNSLVSNIRY